METARAKRHDAHGVFQFVDEKCWDPTTDQVSASHLLPEETSTGSISTGVLQRKAGKDWKSQRSGRPE